MKQIQDLERQINFHGLDPSKYKDFDFRKHGVTINYDFIKEILTNQYLTSQHFLFFMNVLSHYFDNKLVYLDPYMFSQDYMPELVNAQVFKNIAPQQQQQQPQDQIQIQIQQSFQAAKIKKEQNSEQQPKESPTKQNSFKQNNNSSKISYNNQPNQKSNTKEYKSTVSSKISTNEKMKCKPKIFSDQQSEQFNHKVKWLTNGQGDQQNTPQQSIKSAIYGNQGNQGNLGNQQKVQETIKEAKANEINKANDNQQLGGLAIIDNRYIQKDKQDQSIQQQEARALKLSKIFKELKSYYNFTRNPFQETKVSFIPINITNSHWICSVIFSEQKIIQYCDSLNNIDQRIVQGLKQLANHQGDNIEWEFLHESPHQTNNYDCGVFCMRALYQVMLYKKPIKLGDYTQNSISQFRKNLAKLAIITSQIDITQDQVINILNASI